MEQHLQEKTYTKVVDICGYVAQTWGVSYTVSGMTKWLQTHDFRYKQPKGTPAKADLLKQDAFIEMYLQWVADTAANEPILFIDAVHPTMATKISYGWIKKGVDKPIATTSSRTRVNLIGAIELNTMNVISEFVETVNADTINCFFEKLRQSYPQAEKLHMCWINRANTVAMPSKRRLCCMALNSTIYLLTAPILTPSSDYGR